MNFNTIMAIGQGTNNIETTGKSSTDNKNVAQGRTELDKDAFFKLLITQLRNQDPLKPMENQEFVAQMAQFSSLEQMQNMNTSMNTFIKTQSLSEGASLIGKDIETFPDEDGRTIKGIVEKISFEDGKVYLCLKGKEDRVDLNNISIVS